MSKQSDVTVRDVSVRFLPVRNRIPLKFGPETVDRVTCARISITVENRQGTVGVGWGETPLSVTWVWPGTLGYEEREDRMKRFTLELAAAWKGFGGSGHPMEIGHDFQQELLGPLLERLNRDSPLPEPMPHLSALVCCSAFDLALHDAFGVANGIPTYDTYGPAFMNRDLSAYLEPVEGSGISFSGRYPAEFLVRPAPKKLPAWHLVGGTDLLSEDELTGREPDDGYPVLLPDWIRRDGLRCLKVKLRGNDEAWDYDRLVRTGTIGRSLGVEWLTTDFNCTVTDPEYVTGILDRLMVEHGDIYRMILYVEQPFPYDLERNRIDVHAVSARKPLFMDESAHDWHLVRLGRSLGWTGVALKTCKTQTGALLSLAWAKAHGMTLMVQDLTNPMLAMIPHVMLAAHAGTIMGVETNSMQFYPEVSTPEAKVHPGLYTRVNGQVDWSTVQGPGFGYRVSEIPRELPEPARF